ncbi:PKSN polyketide synthase for alternapyrone biosynthesis [Periconia macrospinosa]|uniref:PKSN polyketide synthase for alternapyrone biosynthesis n=1 Tax=Periconia macrospinosa TaxID=97972 RepID=A0A2V1DZ54_9PLEO|nr:PKSN polyketide synthase for alternapyrone biosynthesis [Periconia macrospinosa]
MENYKDEPIAIVGAACRLAGQISSLGDLWDMISKAKTGHCKVPADRWDADTWHHPDPDRKGGIAVKHGYFLDQDVGHFDAPFFSTTAKEAAAMDPMKRLLLEVAYESIENAGIPVENLMDSQTGCYVGCMTNDYEMMSLHDIYDVGHAAASATSEAMIANRVSWFFGMRGPSLTLDTACSSSLYALHLACQSLRLGETEMSLVAGVNLILNPNTMHQLSAMHMLSPEGISHTFDDRANGYGRGEGIGCLVVKRLSDALRDGDTIRCVIRGTGANADGKTPSITQPSSKAQADLIARTYKAAGLSMNETQYFESHGTGTPVGDPIEMEAIASTLGASRAAAGLGPLYVGSVKPTVGHTEGCSGLAGVFKALTCLEHGMLVPTYGVDRLNPKLKLSDWNLVLPSQTMNWPEKGQRRISVNSFGFGGANAHVILDDAYHYLAARNLTGNHSTVINSTLDDTGSDSGISSLGSRTPADGDRISKHLFVFSTKDEAGLGRIASSHMHHLSSKADKQDPQFLGDLSHTLYSRRSHLDFRSFAVAASAEELQAKLKQGLPKTPRASRQQLNLVFIFTGQGAQWPGMGHELIHYPEFRQSIETSQRHLEALGCKWNVLEELESNNIHLPQYSQTLCTVLQVALVDLLRCWQIHPKATLGHSSGEIGAAYAASLITRADAVKIAYVRGLSSADVTRPGAMLAAGLSAEEASDYLKVVPHEAAVVACVNSPSSVTLSGDVEAIDKLEAVISADGKFARKLKVKTAYHSPHMRAVSQTYFDRMGQLSNKASTEDTSVDKVTMFSSLKGRMIESPEELDAHYWVANMENTVQFSDALTALLNQPTQPGKKTPIRWGGFVEIGPHAALKGPVQQTISTTSAGKALKETPYLSAVERGKDAVTTALTAAGQLWARGHNVSLAATNTGELGGKPKVLTDLPSYPWNHTKRFWHESYLMRSNRFPVAPRTDLLGVPEDLSSALEPRWRNHLRLSENPWIEDHQITGTILYPAAGMLVMALEGALQTVAEGDRNGLLGFRFNEVRFDRGLVVTTGDEAVETRLSLQPDVAAPRQFRFTVFSTTSANNMDETLFREIEETSSTDVEWSQQRKVYEELSRDLSADSVDVDAFYDHLEHIGMEYGPLFRNVVELSALPHRSAAHAKIVLPDTLSSMPANFEFPHVMHPATMDSIFHLLLAALNDGRPVSEAAVPYGIDDMFVAYEQPRVAGDLFSGYGKLVSKSTDGHELVGDLIISDEEWSAPKLVITGFTLREVTSGDNTDNTAAFGAAKSRCAELVWNPDIDFVKMTGVQSSLEWLKYFFHKVLVQSVLVIVDDTASSAIETMQSLSATREMISGSKDFQIASRSATALRTISSALSVPESSTMLWDYSGEQDLPTSQTTFDVVIVQPTLSSISRIALGKLRGALSPRGRLVSSNSSTVFESRDMLRISGFENLAYNKQLVAASPQFSVPSIPEELYLLLPSKTDKISTLESSLRTDLSPLATINTVTLSDVPSLAGKHVISLLEAEAPFIYSWTDVEFNSFKTLISTAAHVFWLTRGDLLNAWSGGIEFSPAQGLLRVLRNEYPLVTLPHLDLSTNFDVGSMESVRLVSDVWKATLVPDAENEFAERDGTIFIPRAVNQDTCDKDLTQFDGQAEPVRQSLDECKTPIKPTLALPGNGLLWIEDDSVKTALSPQEVEVSIQNVVLKKSETLQAPETWGRGAVGIVTRCGSDVTSIAPSQQVVVLGNASFKTQVRVHQNLVVPKPSNWTGEQAAAITGVFVEAQYALLELAGLKKGQSILVHSAASSLGQAAIQVAQMVGAQVFALVDVKAEKEVLIDQYGIPTTHIYDAARETFVRGIHQLTDGLGVQVVLNCHPNPATLPSVSTLGEGGFFIDMCPMNSSQPEIRLPSSKRTASILRVNMDIIMRSKAQSVRSLFQQTFNTVARHGYIKPITSASHFSVTDTQDYLQALNDPAQSKNMVVVSFGDSASVLVPPPPPPKLELDPKGTYILAGGLGALGLDVARMMVESGAGHLVFLSRSGGGKNEADLQALRLHGARVDAFKCSVNDAASVANVFNELRNTGCTIKGLIQAAMVLEDGIFDNMTHEKWYRAFEPKTRGSRILLEQLSASTSGQSPFFLLLSSITGVIGNTAQANYASGNTFEDALAHHARANLGIPATSIDIGLVSDSSHFTSEGEFGDIDSYLHRYSHGWKGLQTNMGELRAIMAGLMRRAEQGDFSSSPAQVVLGLSEGLTKRHGTTGFERDRKFALRVIEDGGVAGGGDDKAVSIADALKQSTSRAEAAVAIEDDLKAQIAIAVGVGVNEVDGQKPLFDFGVDSLKAVEIRNRALKEMQSDISVFELLSATPLADIAVKIAAKSALVESKEEE